jgi:hypothetical protein
VLRVPFAQGDPLEALEAALLALQEDPARASL